MKVINTVKYNVNRLFPLDRILVESVNDTDSRALKLELYEAEPFDQTNRIALVDQQVTATYVCVRNPTNGIGAAQKLLLAEDVECQIENGCIIVPVDRAVISSRGGNLKIEVTVSEDGEVFTLPFPINVTVRASVIDDAELCESSQGRVADLLGGVSDTLDRLEAQLSQKENVRYKVTEENIMGVSDLDASYPSLSYTNLLIDDAISDLAEVETGSSILTVAEGYESQASMVSGSPIQLKYVKIDNLLFFELYVGLRYITASDSSPFRININGLPFISEANINSVFHNWSNNTITASVMGYSGRSDFTLSVYTNITSGVSSVFRGFYKIREV